MILPSADRIAEESTPPTTASITEGNPSLTSDSPTSVPVSPFPPFDRSDRHNPSGIRSPFLNPEQYLSATIIPITGGELGKSIHQFLAFLTHKTYDVLQPDARICGGILNARNISILAEACHVPGIQHGTQGLSLAGYIEAGCAMPNCEYLEMIGQPNLPEEHWSPALRVLRTKHVFEIEDGYEELPEIPGLGLDVDADALEEFRVRS